LDDTEQIKEGEEVATGFSEKKKQEIVPKMEEKMQASIPDTSTFIPLYMQIGIALMFLFGRLQPTSTSIWTQ
jgi:hypothetical protein